MKTISICVGSACHLRGAYDILNAINLLIAKHKLEAKVEIEGNFCRGLCTEGVVVMIDGEMITRVSKDNVYNLFCEKILGGDPHTGHHHAEC